MWRKKKKTLFLTAQSQTNGNMEYINRNDKVSMYHKLEQLYQYEGISREKNR